MIELMVYFTGLIGIFVFFSHEIYMIYCSFRSRFFVRRNLRSRLFSGTVHRYGKAGRHLYKVIEGAELMDFYKSIGQFIGISATVFMITFFTLISFFDMRLVIFSSTFIGCIPYFLCLLRLHSRRSSGSREGDILIYEILNNYRIQNFNMKAAIEASALAIEGAPVSKSVLINLSKELNLASSEVEINRALENFRYAFNTAWGSILASNMFLALYRGVNVEKSLEVLSSGVSRGRQIVEYERRENYEASLILKFLAPVCYIFSLCASSWFFDIKVSKFLYYQFRTSLGLKWFIIMSMIYFIAFCAAKVASSEKMDI